MKRIFFVFAFTLSLKLVFGQGIKISQGDKIILDGKKSFFNVLGVKDNILLILGNEKGKKGDEFYLNAYDKNNKYELINSVTLKTPEQPDKAKVAPVFVDIIANSIYVVVTIKDKKETFKKYYAISYTLDLKTKIDWTELLKFNLPEKQINIPFRDWEYVSFNKTDSLLDIIDRNNDEEDLGNGRYSHKREYFDLTFNKVEIPDEENSQEINFEPDKYENYDEIKISGGGYKGDDKYLYVTIASKHEKYYHEPSSQAFYYTLYNSKNDKIKKYGEGKIYTLPDNIYVKDISCFYDSVEDNIVLTGVYNDFNDKKNKPSGLFFIKYNVVNKKLVSSVFSPTSKEFRDAFNNSKIKKGNKHLFNVNRFDIIKQKNGDFFVVDCNWFTSKSSSMTLGVEKTKNTVVIGDIVFFCFDNNGNLKYQNVIERYAEKEVGYDERGVEFYLPFTKKDNISYLVFTDNIKNYTNGIYNLKNKDDISDKNTCLAVITIDEDNKIERKVLVNSVQNEFGVDLMAGGVLEIKENEYIWFAYKDGVGKIITLKVE